MCCITKKTFIYFGATNSYLSIGINEPHFEETKSYQR